MLISAAPEFKMLKNPVLRKTINRIDIRGMLNREEQPVPEFMAAIHRLEEKRILEVIAPFIPAPLLDKSLSLGYSHWLDKRGKEEYRIYFHK